MSRLSIFRDDAFLQDHVLMRDIVALGRHPENDIVLDDRTLSRFHARLERRSNRFVVVDLGGQNGVYLNGTRITGESDLVPGDRIGLGRYVAIFDEDNARSRGRRSPASMQSRGDAPAVDPNATLARNDADISIDIDAFDDLDELDDLDSDVGNVDDDGDDDDDDDEFEGPTTTVEKRRSPRPTLVLLYNGLEVSRHEVANKPLIVGRSKMSDVVIGLLGLSRRHARVARRSDGVYVEDLGSQNGTWVNNARIDGAHRLTHGDLLNFYEYGLLYVDDPDVRISYPGADFTSRPGAADDLASRETDRREPPPLVAGAGGTRGPTQRSPVPILDSDLDVDELGSAEVDASIGALDLGEGSYLGDEFDDAVDEDFAASLLEEEALESGTGTTDVLRAFSSEASAGDVAVEDDDLLDFEDASTSRSGALDFVTDQTTAAARPPEPEAPAPGAGVWPTDAELEEALSQQGADQLASLEVFLDRQLYTQVPLTNIVTRIGNDARCELALPSEVGLCPWHLTLVNFGAATVAYRASARARVSMGERAVDQVVLKDGDELRLGRVRVVYRCR